MYVYTLIPSIYLQGGDKKKLANIVMAPQKGFSTTYGI